MGCSLEVELREVVDLDDYHVWLISCLPYFAQMKDHLAALRSWLTLPIAECVECKEVGLSAGKEFINLASSLGRLVPRRLPTCR